MQQEDDEDLVFDPPGLQAAVAPWDIRSLAAPLAGGLVHEPWAEAIKHTDLVCPVIYDSGLDLVQHAV